MNFLDRLSKNIHISNFMKIRLVEPSIYMLTDERTNRWNTDRRTDMTKLRVSFRNFANAPKNCYIILIEDIPFCWNSKSETKYFKITVKTQQQCINISILLWQHVSVFLNCLQASIQRYEVQSVYIMHCRIPYCLQGVYQNSLKL